MEKIKRRYYYFYYTIYKAWGKDPHLLFSTRFRADLVIGAVKIWTVISLFSYLSIFLGYRIKLSITEPLGLIPLLLVLGSTLYFFTFSNKWKSYFKEFDKLPKRKNQIGRIIVWGIVIFSFINLIFSVSLMKRCIE